MVTAATAAARVADPELGVVTIGELGILRAVETDGDRAVVTITPTYSGCPALAAIRADIVAALQAAGWSEVEIVTRLDPPWSTDWITGAGRAKLAAAGFAPPGPVGAPAGPGRSLPVLSPPRPAPACPRCGAGADEVSRFGATACTSLWRCRSCREPFPHLKAI